MTARTHDPRRAEILAVITNQADRKYPVTEDMTLGAIEMDSLDDVDLAIALEDRFFGDRIIIDDDKWARSTTVCQVIDDVIALLDEVE